jgi:hypothetical protein
LVQKIGQVRFSFADVEEGAEIGSVAGPEGTLAGAGLGLGVAALLAGGGRPPAYVPGGSLTDENGNSIFQFKEGESTQQPTQSQKAESTPAQPPESGGGRNAQKSNQDRKATAQENLSDLQKQAKKLNDKTNKTPQEKEELEKLKKRIAHERRRMQKSENHSRRAKGQNSQGR